MKKVFFLVNRIADFDFSGLLGEHLADCAIFVGDQLPSFTNEFDLVILWNYKKKIRLEDNHHNIILFHGSNLPEGRGWAPIYNSIANGLSHYTISGIFAAEEIDSGNLIVQARFSIGDHYVAADLRRWDTEISLMLVSMILKNIDQGSVIGKKQEGSPSYWLRRKPEDNEIDVHQPFDKLIPHLRACEESHPAFFILNGIKYFVQVRPEKTADFPGDVEILFFDK